MQVTVREIELKCRIMEEIGMLYYGGTVAGAFVWAIIQLYIYIYIYVGAVICLEPVYRHYFVTDIV